MSRIKPTTTMFIVDREAQQVIELRLPRGVQLYATRGSLMQYHPTISEYTLTEIRLGTGAKFA